MQVQLLIYPTHKNKKNQTIYLDMPCAIWTGIPLRSHRIRSQRIIRSKPLFFRTQKHTQDRDTATRQRHRYTPHTHTLTHPTTYTDTQTHTHIQIHFYILVMSISLISSFLSTCYDTMTPFLLPLQALFVIAAIQVYVWLSKFDKKAASLSTDTTQSKLPSSLSSSSISSKSRVNSTRETETETETEIETETETGTGSGSECESADSDRSDRSDSKNEEASDGALPMIRLRRSLSVYDRVKHNKNVVNPFVNEQWRMSTCERVRISIAAVTIVPLKLALVVLTLFVAFIFASIATVGLELQPKKPLSRWRCIVTKPIAWCSRVILFALGFIWIRTEGKRASRKAAPVVIGNHTTFIDPLYMIYAYLPSAVAAYENLKIPMVGTICRALQVLAVDRRSPTSRQDTLEQLKHRGDNDAYPQLLVFPEGTTTNGRALITFKKGAFVPGQPVQAVVFEFDHNDRFHPAWVSAGPPLSLLLVRMLAEPWHGLCVKFLPPYVPTEEEKNNVRLFSQNVRTYMAGHMGVVATEHSFEDVRLQIAAMKADLPPGTAVVEFGALKQLDDSVDTKVLEKHLKRFAEMDVDRNGLVNLEEFLEFYGVKDSAVTANLFHLLDEDEDGYVSFREYMIGMGLTNSAISPDALIRLAFRMFDLDHDNHIDVADLRSVFERVFSHFTPKQIDEILPFKSGKVTFEQFDAFARTNDLYVTTFRQHFFGDKDNNAADVEN
jgi:lysophosphatidylcholine acyltransferase / lyso-PAF acetyltransferase